MTYNEVTLFRRFMTNKGVLNNFEYLYQQHKFDMRPVAQYYEDTAADLVIMTAFDFDKCGSTIYSYSYWEKLDQKWQFCLKQFRLEGKMENPPAQRCSKCGKMKPITEYILGKRLVPHKFCKECEENLVARKVEKNQRRDWLGQPAEKITKTCPHCGKRKSIDEFYKNASKKDGHQPYCKDCMREYIRVRLRAKEKEQTKSTTQTTVKMEDFTFYDFDKTGTISDRVIDKGKAAINYKNKKGSYLSFGIRESSEIISKGLLKMRVRVDNITGAIHLLFNKEQGAPAAVRNKKNITLVNQQLVDFLADRLGLEKKPGVRHIINIGDNISNSDGFVTYGVTK